MRRTGQLLVLEGPDGVGKSTLAAALADRLREGGLACSVCAFPGNESGTLGSLVYRLHHDGPALGVEEIAPVALQAAHVAAHLDAIEREIRPRLSSGENVVLDRYWWSTVVYGSLSGISPDILESLITAESLCWGDLQPLVVFLIDRHRPWRESDDAVRWHQLAQEYRDLAAREQAHTCVVVINNDVDAMEVVTSMADTVTGIIRRLEGLPQDDR